jgi:hypothetical protein
VGRSAISDRFNGKEVRVKKNQNEIESLNERILNANDLTVEDLERVAAASEETCIGFSGPCPTFSGTCIRYNTQIEMT